MSAGKSKTFPFPHATVTPISGRPDPLSLSILQGNFYANAISVPTELGGGLYGHLALVMNDAEYAALEGTVAYATSKTTLRPVPPRYRLHSSIASHHVRIYTGPSD